MLHLLASNRKEYGIENIIKKYLEKAILHIADIKPVRFMGTTCQTVNLARTASFEPLIVQK